MTLKSLLLAGSVIPALAILAPAPLTSVMAQAQGEQQEKPGQKPGGRPGQGPGGAPQQQRGAPPQQQQQQMQRQAPPQQQQPAQQQRQMPQQQQPAQQQRQMPPQQQPAQQQQMQRPAQQQQQPGQQRLQERVQERQDQLKQKAQERQDKLQERQDQLKQKVQERQDQLKQKAQERQDRLQRPGQPPAANAPQQPAQQQRLAPPAGQTPGTASQQPSGTPGATTPPGRQPLPPQQQQRDAQPPATIQQQPGRPGVGTGPGGVPPAALQRPGQPPQGQGAAPGGAPGSVATQAPAATPPNVRRLEDFRSQRREVREGDRTIIQEPGRTIVREGNITVIQRPEGDRFRRGARDVQTERRGNEMRTIAERPDGTRIITVTDDNGRLLRRIRRDRGGNEYILIENTHRSGMGVGTAIGVGMAAGVAAGLGAAYLANLPPPVVTIPPEEYIVETRRSRPGRLYETLAAPPIQPIERPYTLDEIRYTHALRERMRRIDVDTVTFDTGSWEVRPDQYGSLEVIANAIRRVTERSPDEVFLIEGHTDAVGADIDNLSLSDRRAEAIAVALSEQFSIPPENLTTQGYGEQYPKIPVAGPEEQNRRVTVRRITPLLAGKQ